MRLLLSGLLAVGLSCSVCGIASAQEPPKDPPKEDLTKVPAMKSDVEAAKTEAAKGAADATTAAHKYADIAWVLTASAFVMLMLPGLALFYGGMSRRKHILGTMMQTMVALGIVGVQWVVIGYPLAFGESYVKFKYPGTETEASAIGFSKELVLISPEAAVGKTTEDVLKERKIDPATATDEQKKDATAE